MERNEQTVRGVESVDFRATAVLLQRGGTIGRFTVQSLSAGGAILTGGHDVRCSAPLRVVLELPSGEALTVGAHVKRRATTTGNLVALAVAFRHISAASEDRIQDALLELLDAKNRADHPAVLIVDPSAPVRAELAARVASLGRRVLAVEAPLSALRYLDDPRENVGAVLVRDSSETRAGLELLELVADEREGVRALLLVDDPRADPFVAHGIARCAPEHLRDALA